MKEQQSGRLFFKYLNWGMVFMWRLGMGKLLCLWPEVAGKYMVITHRGRKSGKQFRTPVNYAEHEGEVYCVAGFGPGSDWYRNLIANPQVEIWLPDGWYAGAAEPIPMEHEKLPILRAVLINSGFAARMLGVNPAAISDEALETLAADYRLIKITRQSARTGADGPGDLAWIWPLFVLWLLFFRRSKRK